jgi:hypothetical protein
MARQKIFTEVATVDFPQNAPWEFTSRLTGEPNSGFPSGTHQDRGKLLKKTQNGNDIVADYEGTLTIRGESYDWTSHETSKVVQGGNVEGTEDVIFKKEIPGVPKQIEMDTKWEKDGKKVTNIGYR